MTHLRQRAPSMRLDPSARAAAARRINAIRHRGTFMAALLIHLAGVWIHACSLILQSGRN